MRVIEPALGPVELDLLEFAEPADATRPRHLRREDLAQRVVAPEAAPEAAHVRMVVDVVEYNNAAHRHLQQQRTAGSEC